MNSIHMVGQKRRALAAAGVFVAVLGLAAGCGKDDTTAGESSSSATTAASRSSYSTGQPADWDGAIAIVRDTAKVQGDDAHIRGLIQAACDSYKVNPSAEAAARKLTEPPHNLPQNQAAATAGTAAALVCYGT